MRLVIECVLQEFGSLIEAAICDIDVSLGQGIPSGRRQLVRRSAGGAGKGAGSGCSCPISTKAGVPTRRSSTASSANRLSCSSASFIALRRDKAMSPNSSSNSALPPTTPSSRVFESRSSISPRGSGSTAGRPVWPARRAWQAAPPQDAQRGQARRLAQSLADLCPSQPTAHQVRRFR